MTEHKFASLLRMAADNADQRFECGENDGFGYNILSVMNNPDYDWKPVAKPKKTIKRWLWSSPRGNVTANLYSQDEVSERFVDTFPIKLLWSETTYEVDDE